MIFAGLRARSAVVAAGVVGSFSVAYSSFNNSKQSSLVSCDQAAVENALSKKEFREFKLISSEPLTHNTSVYRFAFPSEDMISGLNTASCLVAKAKIDGKVVVRPYTPVTNNTQKGFMDLIIKTYPAPGGLMSRHIAGMKPGETLQMKGPFTKIAYKPNMKKKIGMIAGGSGITPMLQVAKEILNNPSDKTEVSLIFANVTEKDIILRDELDAMAFLYPNFKVHYTLDRPPASGWKYGKGYVTKEMIEEHMPSTEEKEGMVMVCGPPGFMKHISGDKNKDKSQGDLTGVLKEMGYVSDQVFKF